MRSDLTSAGVTLAIASNKVIESEAELERLWGMQMDPRVKGWTRRRVDRKVRRLEKNIDYYYRVIDRVRKREGLDVPNN